MAAPKTWWISTKGHKTVTDAKRCKLVNREHGFPIAHTARFQWKGSTIRVAHTLFNCASALPTDANIVAYISFSKGFAYSLGRYCLPEPVVCVEIYIGMLMRFLLYIIQCMHRCCETAWPGLICSRSSQLGNELKNRFFLSSSYISSMVQDTNGLSTLITLQSAQNPSTCVSH